MGDSFKPKISVSGNKDPVLKQAEKDYMKVIEQKNLERVNRLKLMQKKNRYTAGIIGTTVLGIYFYSMYAIKQETFLDDFEEPAKILKE